MALFGRTPLDPELKDVVGRRRVLATGRSPLGQVLGLADALVYFDGVQAHELPWHEVEHGGWNRDSRTLRWTTVDAAEGRVELTETGLLPDLFNERVTASIACMRTVESAAGKTAVITARRDLSDTTAPLVWRVSAGKGARPADVADDPLVALELERLRAEYDAG